MRNCERALFLTLAIPLVLAGCQSDPGDSIPESSSYLSSSSTASVPIYTDGPLRLEESIPAVGDDGIRYVEVPNSDIVLYEDQPYEELEEVAAYIQFFDHTPVNYVTEDRKDEITRDNGLTLINGTFQNREGYLPSGYEYTEIDLRAGYSYGMNLGRGSQRIVYGTDEDGKVERVFYTRDHYDNFREYLNYYEGWSDLFGQDGDYSLPIDVPVITVDDSDIFTWDGE